MHFKVGLLKQDRFGKVHLTDVHLLNLRIMFKIRCKYIYIYISAYFYPEILETQHVTRPRGIVLTKSVI